MYYIYHVFFDYAEVDSLISISSKAPRIMNAESKLNTPSLDGEDNSLSPETQQGKVYLGTIYHHTYIY